MAGAGNAMLVVRFRSLYGDQGSAFEFRTWLIPMPSSAAERSMLDPRKKKSNDQRIPLLDASGYDACKIIEKQGRFSNIREGRIFPYNGGSVGAAFRRQGSDLKIDDLHFHDLRHGRGWRQTRAM